SLDGHLASESTLAAAPLTSMTRAGELSHSASRTSLDAAPSLADPRKSARRDPADAATTEAAACVLPRDGSPCSSSPQLLPPPPPGPREHTAADSAASAMIARSLDGPEHQLPAAPALPRPQHAVVGAAL